MEGQKPALLTAVPGEVLECNVLRVKRALEANRYQDAPAARLYRSYPLRP